MNETGNGDDSGPRHELLLSGVVSTSLGRIMLAGSHRFGPGVVTPKGGWRVYGSYAIVVVTAGGGRYADASGRRETVVAGDILFVFPELPHRYGPGRTRGIVDRWDEIYLTFDGPAFDLWRAAKILDPSRPVRRAGGSGLRVGDSLRRWIDEFAAPAPQSTRLRQITELLGLLNDACLIHETGDGGVPDARPEGWLDAARAWLDTDFSRPLPLSEVAARANMGYESFRKRFVAETGISPARYRMRRKIEAACQMLRFHPERTNAEIAAALGFSDEFHFSRRFTELRDESPRAFRQRHRKPEILS